MLRNRGKFIRTLLSALLAFGYLFPLAAATIRLYLKDGTFQIVREYKIEGDRVRYYTTERGDWEEVPADLVDFKKTEAEVAATKQASEETSKVIAEEVAAEKAQTKEVSLIPLDEGLYTLDESQKLRVFPLADSTLHNNKGRSVLKVLSPVPLFSGKATIEVKGERSANLVTQDRQEFFVQLGNQERFGIIRLTPGKNIRVVEKIEIVPVSKEIIETADEIEIFRKQLTESGLFKIWPTKPLAPGEYAVIQFTKGEANPRIWDFAYRP